MYCKSPVRLLARAKLPGQPHKDIEGKPHRPVPSLGAWEIRTVISNTEIPAPDVKVVIYPNPAASEIVLMSNTEVGESICIYDMEGNFVEQLTGGRDEGRLYFEVS